MKARGGLMFDFCVKMDTVNHVFANLTDVNMLTPTCRHVQGLILNY